jgi:hypothetical protein
MIDKNNTPERLDQILSSDIITNKFGLQVVAESISKQIADGYVNPLEMAVRVKALEELAKLVRSSIETRVINEVLSTPNMKLEFLGAKISVVDVPKYDYSNVKGWAELNDQIAELTEKRKSIEDTEKKWRKGSLPLKSSAIAYKVELGANPSTVQIKIEG